VCQSDACKQARSRRVLDTGTGDFEVAEAVHRLRPHSERVCMADPAVLLSLHGPPVLRIDQNNLVCGLLQAGEETSCWGALRPFLSERAPVPRPHQRAVADSVHCLVAAVLQAVVVLLAAKDLWQMRWCLI
jgi:hypothetical protein